MRLYSPRGDLPFPSSHLSTKRFGSLPSLCGATAASSVRLRSRLLYDPGILKHLFRSYPKIFQISVIIGAIHVTRQTIELVTDRNKFRSLCTFREPCFQSLQYLGGSEAGTHHRMYRLLNKIVAQFFHCRYIRKSGRSLFYE